MRILFVNSSYGCGGAERVIVNLANHWSSLGNEIKLVSVQHTVNCSFEVNDDIEIVSLQKSNSKLIIPLRKIASFFRFRGIVSDFKPDVVISFQTQVNIATILGMIGTRIPLIISERNHPKYKLQSSVVNLLRKHLYRFADKLVVQTKGIKEWFIENGFDKEKLAVIPNPVGLATKELTTLSDGEANADKHRLAQIENQQPAIINQQQESRVIIACGRLVPQKGFSELIEMFAEIAPESPDWTLRIIGDGPERERLENLAKDLFATKKAKATKRLSTDYTDVHELEANNQQPTTTNDSRVELAGYQKNPAEFYHRGEIFCFTSHYEGFPNALCEAMASGMAVVSFDCPSGPSDIIEHDVNGLLVKDADKVEFIKQLRQLMQDKEFRLRLGKEAETISETLSTVKVAQLWTKQIEQTKERRSLVV